MVRELYLNKVVKNYEWRTIQEKFRTQKKTRKNKLKKKNLKKLRLFRKWESIF